MIRLRPESTGLDYERLQSNRERNSREVILRRKTDPSNKLMSRLQRHAQERADEAARCVPWQVLLETRSRYLEWQEFYYWARSIMECEERVPDWLVRKLDEMCPGFLDCQGQHSSKQGNASACAIRLGEWIDEHIFGFAAQAGWLPAVTFYAVREPRYGKVSAHWSECVKKWREATPPEYPSFEEWLREAQRCDETIDLLLGIREQRECFKLVQLDRLAEAVERYVDWEAFAYWARAALEQKPPLASEVTRELETRCPGFSQLNARQGAEDVELPSGWDRLMLWIGDNFFQEAKTEGWFEAIMICERMHPRAIRTMEYANHCDDIWKGELPEPYPSFATWRRDADRYVECT